eukprot:Gb_29122 [translate_table: standard]
MVNLYDPGGTKETKGNREAILDATWKEKRSFSLVASCSPSATRRTQKAQEDAQVIGGPWPLVDFRSPCATRMAQRTQDGAWEEKVPKRESPLVLGGRCSLTRQGRRSNQGRKTTPGNILHSLCVKGGKGIQEGAQSSRGHAIGRVQRDPRGCTVTKGPTMRLSYIAPLNHKCSLWLYMDSPTLVFKLSLIPSSDFSHYYIKRLGYADRLIPVVIRSPYSQALSTHKPTKYQERTSTGREDKYVLIALWRHANPTLCHVKNVVSFILYDFTFLLMNQLLDDL